MKRSIAVILLAIALVVLSASPVAACNEICAYHTLPWGEPEALCLALPEDHYYLICIELNFGFIHECYEDQICVHGFPIP